MARKSESTGTSTSTAAAAGRRSRARWPVVAADGSKQTAEHLMGPDGRRASPARAPGVAWRGETREQR